MYGRDPFKMIWVDDLRPVEALMDRLKYEPLSIYRANELGSDDFLGYDLVVARLDNIQDELRNIQYVQQKVAGSKKAKKPRYVERPKQTNKYKPASLDDVGSFFA